jgi:hypothetical protein
MAKQYPDYGAYDQKGEGGEDGENDMVNATAEEVVDYLVEYERVMEDSKRKRKMAKLSMRYYPSP